MGLINPIIDCANEFKEQPGSRMPRQLLPVIIQVTVSNCKKSIGYPLVIYHPNIIGPISTFMK